MRHWVDIARMTRKDGQMSGQTSMHCALKSSGRKPALANSSAQGAGV
ncbi:hypothetical protein [Candidatus Fukatsuia endosymbiont of Tuberolachnus salignus]